MYRNLDIGVLIKYVFSFLCLDYFYLFKGLCVPYINYIVYLVFDNYLPVKFVFITYSI